jgi:hypothetical protein
VIQKFWEAILAGVAAAGTLLGKFLWGGSDKVVTAIASLQLALVTAIEKEGRETRQALHRRIDVLEEKIEEATLEDVRREIRAVERTKR